MESVSERATRGRSAGACREYAQVGSMTDVKGQSTRSASGKQVGCLVESGHRRDTKVMFGCRL